MTPNHPLRTHNPTKQHLRSFIDQHRRSPIPFQTFQTFLFLTWSLWGGGRRWLPGSEGESAVGHIALLFQARPSHPVSPTQKDKKIMPFSSVLLRLVKQRLKGGLEGEREEAKPYHPYKHHKTHNLPVSSPTTALQPTSIQKDINYGKGRRFQIAPS